MDLNVCFNLEEKHSSAAEEYVNKIQSFRNDADKLFYIYNLQKLLQKQLYNLYPEWNFDPDNLKNQKDILEFFEQQVEYIEDELRELANALGGVNTFGSAGWKRHKEKHGIARNYLVILLPDEDKKEILYEYIDILHFVLNLLIPIENIFGKKTVEDIFNATILYAKDAKYLYKNYFKHEISPKKDIETIWDAVKALRESSYFIRRTLSSMLLNLASCRASKKDYETYAFEAIELLNHFFSKLKHIIDSYFNKYLSIEEIAIYYVYKNIENLERQKNSY